MFAITALPFYNYCKTPTVFIRINAPGVMHFSKGEAIIKDKKNQLSSPVAMGGNGSFTALISLGRA